MRLEEYRESLNKPLKKATLCYLVKEDKILLAMKKRGFGEGKWNGVGGKKKPEDKTIEAASTRETEEEIKVKPISFTKVAVFNFFFPHDPDSNQQVHVFLVDKWKGKPVETEEVKPKWHKKDEIPFNSMWSSDRHWLPIVLMGQKIRGDFIFGKGELVRESMIRHKLR